MKEQLSALIDGELDVKSAEHIIAAAKAGGDVKHAWSNYHLIGDAMRGESHVSQDFTARFMSKLDAEPIIFMPNARNNSVHNTGLEANIDAPSRASYLQQKFATNNKIWSIAASVAAVMFVSAMVLQLNQTAELAPVEIAQSVPMEYLQAHQVAAPNAAAYYIHNANFTEQQTK